MNREQFLDELKCALAGEVSANVMMESLSYYANYRDDEVKHGKSVDEVIEELGKPALIAKTIIAAQSGERNADYEYTEDGHTRTVRHTSPLKSHSFDLSKIISRIALVFLIILFIILFCLVIRVGVWVLVTFGIPILLIMGIVYLIMYFAGEK